MYRRIETMIVYLRENLHRNLSVEEMASLVELSPSRFAHVFKAETGASPAEFFNKVRFAKARELIEQGKTVREAMNAVGLSDRSHFVRDFKRAHGLSPGNYKSKHGLPGDKEDL